jgi:hypothetical protein
MLFCWMWLQADIPLCWIETHPYYNVENALHILSKQDGSAHSSLLVNIDSQQPQQNKNDVQILTDQPILSNCDCVSPTESQSLSKVWYFVPADFGSPDHWGLGNSIEVQVLSELINAALVSKHYGNRGQHWSRAWTRDCDPVSTRGQVTGFWVGFWVLWSTSIPTHPT